MVATLIAFFIIALLAGLTGAAVGWLIATLRSRSSTANDSQHLREQLARNDAELQLLRANGEVLKGKCDQLAKENETLKLDQSRLQQLHSTDVEKLNWLAAAQNNMREAFQALAGQSLKDNAAQLIAGTKGSVVDPLRLQMEQLDQQVRLLEQKREGAYASLTEQLRLLMETNASLQKQTTQLSVALKNSSVRGRWGELQLRRIVEMSGMGEHIVFDEQVAISDDSRPDMLVYLPNGASVPIDSKAPMTAFLESLEATDDNLRKSKLDEHVRALRSRVKELGQKRYWEKLDRSPEFVIMFVPNEACLSAAFSLAPDLLEEAFDARVVVSTPTMLLALLKTVAIGWQQTHLNDNARQIAEQGRELLKRLSKMAEHSNKLSKELNGAIDAHNAMVGSLQTRVVPTLRRLEELAGVSEMEALPDEIDKQARNVTTPELVSARDAL
jgi:DNA recombination protein RmuC